MLTKHPLKLFIMCGRQTQRGNIGNDISMKFRG
jgi:hypothetical protein